MTGRIASQADSSNAMSRSPRRRPDPTVKANAYMVTAKYMRIYVKKILFVAKKRFAV
jgi:hypothetical protein